MPVELSDAIKNLRYIPSSIEGLNEVYGGYVYNSDEIVALYGKPQVGKTLFCLQEAVASNANVLYIDTEGGFRGMASKWLDVLRARFKTEGKIYLESSKNLMSLMEFFGFKTKVVFQTAGDDEDEEDDFQLPLSGSQTSLRDLRRGMLTQLSTPSLGITGISGKGVKS